MPRLFIALALPDTVKTQLAAWQKEAGRKLQTGRLTKRENLHLTLYFLGNAEDRDLPGIIAAMEDAAKRFSAFEAVVHTVGRFPRKRILWAQVAPEDRMAELHASLTEGLGRSKERFASHITVVRNARERDAPLPPLPTISFRVEALTLFESTQSKSGVVYTPLASASLS